MGQLLIVFKGPLLGILLDEKVAWIDDCHLGDEFDIDAQLVDLFRENITGNEIAEGVLLPVNKVLGRADRETVTMDRRAKMRRRSQAYQMWR